MMNIKFINATSVQLVDQAGNTVSNVGEFISPTEFSYSGNSFSKNEQNYYHFAITGTNVQLSGSIGDVTEGYQYWNLFKGQTAITNASNLTLDATTLKDWCYANMFLGCTNLTTPPIISGTSLARWCCQGMFAGCNSLTAAPLLPATTLAQNCYYAMFYGCKSLSASPYLPATTLVPWCYTSMFYNCQNLTSISANFNSWTPSTATKNWVTGIDTKGTFYNNNVDFIYGVDNVPESWIDYSKTPLTFKSLGNVDITFNGTGAEYNLNNEGWNTYQSGSVISLTDNDVVSFKGSSPQREFAWNTSGTGKLICYGNLKSIKHEQINNYAYWFYNCTNIIDASNLILPSTDLDNSCYAMMFNGCSSLTSAPALPATTVTQHCYESMFANCVNLTKVPTELPATILYQQSYYGMFQNCTSLITPPIISATTMANFCCGRMFKGCTSLTAAPELLATTTAPGCFSEMFSGCSNLSSINVNFTDWKDAYNTGTTDWVSGVASNGTFTKPTALPLSTGESYIPQGWNVVEK